MKPKAPRNQYKKNVVKSKRTGEKLETNAKYSKEEMWKLRKMYGEKLAIIIFSLLRSAVPVKWRGKRTS